MASHPDFGALYSFQDQALEVLRQVDTGLYLTGGTAASRGYLDHRYSDDLDLFANDDSRFVLWADRVVRKLDSSDSWSTELVLREERFARLFLHRSELSLKIEMVNDVPSRVGEVVVHPALGRLDSAENILANKLSAVVDREEPKDLADIWGFCTRLGLSIEEALKGAQGKAAGLFPADVARVLLNAQREDWQAVRWIDAPDPEIFLTELYKLGERLLLLPNIEN